MERRGIAVRGIVQGVGFRPFVYALASRLSLAGYVRNAPDGVVIEVEGDLDDLERFETELTAQAPPTSIIDQWVTATLTPLGDTGFRIDTSAVAANVPAGQVQISPDVATCERCLADLFDSSNRRFEHPFTTCATCGPRLTIVTSVPYDRERTTMRPFALCDDCRREYEDPADRRFHAETIACPSCGPQLRVLGSDGASLHGGVSEVAVALCNGRIAAVKGLGGYHLACDATSADAVAELRRRKHRDEKPFAVMFESLEAAATVCCVDVMEATLLLSAARPIVLLRRRANSVPTAPVLAVAPKCPDIGVMLPSTPLHYLLMRAVARPVVMTSGNRSGEPIAYEDTDAVTRLAGIADIFVTHDRPIHVRCDDGVTRVAGGRELPVRRSRGHAPRPIRLPIACQTPMLAVGGHLKNTFALGRGHDAFVSHHIGDLDDLSASEAFRRDIALYEDVFDITPRVIAHDLHPGYGSTRYAIERAAGAEAVRTIAVQHHHAHVASCMAEHSLVEPVIGVAFDGTGYGEDGTVWGGEFLVGDALAVQRAAHLRSVPLPGGDQGIREPWRMALAHLLDAGLDPSAMAERVGRERTKTVERMIERRLNTPLTSSAGRLFDAIAAIAGVRDRVTFEGQAAMELEWLACDASLEDGYGHEMDLVDDRLVIDTRPMITGASVDATRGRSPSLIARRFHSALAQIVESVCRRLRDRTGIDAVVLTGGVFLNVILTEASEERLARLGFRVFRHHVVPPGDGGISLGQLAVAAARSHTPCA